jgi:hypothetical protein
LWLRDTSQYLITRDQSRADNSGNIIELLIEGVPVFVALPHLSQEQKAGVYGWPSVPFDWKCMVRDDGCDRRELV